MLVPPASADFKPPPTIFDPQTCIRKGSCPVTQLNGEGGNPSESHSLYYEVHGSGPEKVVLIMGMNTTAAGWQHQVEYFAHNPEYSVLVFDNRGVGNSGTPRGPYTTSGMADDVATLLEFVGWTEAHLLHVVGISLGGMIAQELATKIPERIISLSLIVTKSGRRYHIDLPSYIGVKNLFKATLMTTNPEDKIPLVLEMLFSKDWLSSRDPLDPEGRTHRETETLMHLKRVAVTPPQTFLGAISQMAAATTHYVSPDRLRKISATIPKVIIVTGDTDNLVDPKNSYYMKDNMPEAEFVVRKGAGHGIALQEKQWFNELLERSFKEGRGRASERAV